MPVVVDLLHLVRDWHRGRDWAFKHGIMLLRQGKRIQDVAYRMHVATPAPRDRQARPPMIPPTVAAARARAAAAAEPAKKKTEKDLQVPLPSWMIHLSASVNQRCLVALPGCPGGCLCTFLPLSLVLEWAKNDNGAACLVTQEESGGAGVYSADMRKRYALEDPSWRYDIMPEIIEGHNVLDFVDPDIEARLEALDREEEAMAAAAELEVRS